MRITNPSISAAFRAGTPERPVAAAGVAPPAAGAASPSVGRCVAAGSRLSPQASTGAIATAHQIVLRTAWSASTAKPRRRKQSAADGGPTRSSTATSRKTLKKNNSPCAVVTLVGSHSRDSVASPVLPVLKVR